jgi:hypothetical protein
MKCSETRSLVYQGRGKKRNEGSAVIFHNKAIKSGLAGMKWERNEGSAQRSMSRVVQKRSETE